MPATAVFVGVRNINDCRQEPFIPIYLIGFGIAACCKLLVYAFRAVQGGHTYLNNKEESSKITEFFSCLQVFLSLFLVAWFIFGNVWVYRIYRDFYFHHSSSYRKNELDCSVMVYLFAFWLINMTYAVITCSCCCYWTYSCLKGNL